MAELGSLLYVAFALLVYMFWRRVRGETFEEILESSEREHHRVARVLKKHPHGGTWPEFQAWLKGQP